MKLSVLTLIALIGTAAAEEKQDVCVQMDSLAKNIMEARQAGVELSRMIELSKKNNVYEAVKPLLIAAYDYPVFTGEQYQKKAVLNFKNDVYLQCLKMKA